jgi:hypothetical protein
MKFIAQIEVSGSSRALHVDLTDGMMLRIQEGKRQVDKGVFSAVCFDIAAALKTGGGDAKLEAVTVNVAEDGFWFTAFDDLPQSDVSTGAFSFDDLKLYKQHDLTAIFNVEFFEGFETIDHVGSDDLACLIDNFAVNEEDLAGKKIGVKSVFMDATRVLDVLPVESMRMAQQRG